MDLEGFVYQTLQNLWSKSESRDSEEQVRNAIRSFLENHDISDFVCDKQLTKWANDYGYKTDLHSPQDEQVEIEKKLLITTEALEKIATAGTYWGETMRQYAVDALNDVNQL